MRHDEQAYNTSIYATENQSESDEYIKKLGELSVCQEIDTTGEHGAHRPGPERKPSIGSMKAERERLALDREVNLVHKALQGLFGDEDEAREIPNGATLPRAKLAFEGQIEETENTIKEWSGEGEEEVWMGPTPWIWMGGTMYDSHPRSSRTNQGCRIS